MCGYIVNSRSLSAGAASRSSSAWHHAVMRALRATLRGAVAGEELGVYGGPLSGLNGSSGGRRDAGRTRR